MLIGYRGWKIRNISGEPVLESPAHGSKQDPQSRFFWAPGENVARCPLGCAVVPSEECSCGIYSLKSPEPDLASYHPDIIGQVLVWGRVVEGEIGYRSSHAMVSLFLLPSVEVLEESWLELLSKRYNAPLVKAKEPILTAISKARKEILMKRGKLPIVAAIDQYKKHYDWKNKREYSPTSEEKEQKRPWEREV